MAISHALAKKNYKAPDTKDQFGHFENLQDINIFLDAGAYCLPFQEANNVHQEIRQKENLKHFTNFWVRQYLICQTFTE